MIKLIVNYLARTTAHGFDRLLNGPARGNGGRFRKLWAVAIAVSFVSAGSFIASSVKEIQENPVASDVGYVPTLVSL